MKSMKLQKRYANKSIPFFCLLLLALIVVKSEIHAQAGGLEGIVIETYYITDAKDSTDVLSGQDLAVGSKTYRIYADLVEGFKLQMVYGTEGHPLSFKTSTSFFNNKRGGKAVGNEISRVKLGENTVPIDSWITIGAVSQHHWGVLKSEDPDSSVIGGKYNDGGSATVAGGLLTNNDPEAGIPITEKDGYIEMPAPKMVFYNFKAPEFFKGIHSSFYTEDGVYGVLEGVTGPTEDNLILIAQITTDGDLEFELNLQLLAPYGGPERYVARNPDGNEFTHPDLIYPKTQINN